MKRVRIVLILIIMLCLSMSLQARSFDRCLMNERILLGVVSVFSSKDDGAVARSVDDLYGIVESVPVAQRKSIRTTVILALASLMSHPNNYVKITIANALGDLGSYAQPALPALRVARDAYVEPPAPGVVVAPSVDGVFEISEAIQKIEAGRKNKDTHSSP